MADNKSKNIFNRIRVNTPEELMEFLEKNFEYGLKVDNEYIPIMGREYNKNNKILIDTDSQVLKNTYYDLPKKIKNLFKDNNICKLGSDYLLLSKWTLESYKDMVPRTIGTLPDLIELEAD